MFPLGARFPEGNRKEHAGDARLFLVFCFFFLHFFWGEPSLALLYSGLFWGPRILMSPLQRPGFDSEKQRVRERVKKRTKREWLLMKLRVDGYRKRCRSQAARENINLQFSGGYTAPTVKERKGGFPWALDASPVSVMKINTRRRRKRSIYGRVPTKHGTRN